MTKPIATEEAVSKAQLHVAQPARAGLFLVKPSVKSDSNPTSRRGRQPRSVSKTRTVGLWTLAAAALAAPLFWWAHELLLHLQPR